MCLTYVAGNKNKLKNYKGCMINNRLKLTVLLIILSISFSFAQDNVFVRMGRNFQAYFNTYYNAKIYFKEAQLMYEEEEDKDKISSKTRTALNSAARQAELVIDRFPESDYIDDCLYFNSICKYQLKRYKRSLENLEKLTLKYPDSPYYFEAKLWIAKSYYETDRQAIAYDLLQRFLDNSKNKAYFSDAYQLIGYLALQEGDKEKALASFVEAAERSSSKEVASDMYLETVKLYLENKNYETALKMAGKALRNVKFDEQRAKAMLSFVEIYRIQKDYDKAFEYIEEGLKDARIASYWGDFYFEQANILFQQGRVKPAIKQLLEIVDDEQNEYKNNKQSNAWAKAALHLGNYYIFDHFVEDSAEIFYKKAQTKRRRCAEGKLAEQQLSKLNDLKKVNKELGVLEKNEAKLLDGSAQYYVSLRDSSLVETEKRNMVLADTLDADQSKKDSLMRAAQVNYNQFGGDYEDFTEESEEYAQTLITAAGIFLFDFEIPDTAMAIYQQITENLDYVQSVAQALYSQAYVYRYEFGMEDKADSIQNSLIKNYPDAAITLAVTGVVPPDSVRFYEIEDQIFQIEKHMDKRGYRSGLNRMKKLLYRPGLDKDHRGEIAYRIAWLYDNELSYDSSPIDSTLEYYRMVSETMPDHPLNQASALRVAAIETELEEYQAFLRGDSLGVDQNDTLEGDFTDNSNEQFETNREDGRKPHTIKLRLKSPARPRPVRL